MAIDPERTIGREAFLDRMDALCAMMKTTPAAKAAEPVLVPGEPEAAKIADCTANGVPFPPAWYAEIQGLARGARPRSLPPQSRTCLFLAFPAPPPSFLPGGPHTGTHSA